MSHQSWLGICFIQHLLMAMLGCFLAEHTSIVLIILVLFSTAKLPGELEHGRSNSVLARVSALKEHIVFTNF